MIDEYLELKELKEKYNKIRYLLFEKGSGLSLIVKPKETISKIKRIINGLII